MPILDYSYDDPIGYEGQLHGASDVLIDSALNVTGYDDLTPDQKEQLKRGEYDAVYPILIAAGNWLAYGRGVQFVGTSGNDKVYKLASDATKPIAGVAVLVHLYERHGGPQNNGVPPLKQFGILRRGDIIVYSETPANKYDPVFCRVVATATTRRGQFRNSAVSGETVHCPNAYYLQTISAPGLVPIRFDFTTNLNA